MKIAPKLLFIVAASALAVPAPAAPSGPSAKSAARLKKYPTSRWLAHYLPDDRYKIAGGVWKYVSTDLDTYYHRPNSPLMLRQPAGRVIGFSSAQEAEEAGYRPDPSLAASQGGGAAMGFEAGGGNRAVARTARRVTLADGASSMVVPAGWRIVRGAAQTSQFGSSTRDQFLGPSGQRLLVETFSISGAAAPNVDFGKFLNVQFFKNLEGSVNQVNSALNSSSMVNSQISGQGGAMSRMNMLKKYRIHRANLSGIEGIGVTAKTTIIGQPNRAYAFGRGAKMWSVEDFSRGRQSAMALIKTLRLR